MRLVCDLEADNLLPEVTKIHCVAVEDMDSSYSELFIADGNGRIGQFLELIDDPEVELIGHNIYNYDLKVIEKLYGWKPHKGQKITDTMLLAQIVFPDIDNNDHLNNHGGGGKVFSNKEKGSHSLKAWGQRIMRYKGDYEGGFSKYNDEMGAYCIRDVQATKALCHFLESKIPDALEPNSIALDIENAIAPILSRQQAHGVLFDRAKAEQFFAMLQSNLVDLKWKLQEVFKPRYVSLGEFTPKRDDKAKGYKAGCVLTKIKLQEFNPGSRQQIVDRLINEFNWNPEEYTDVGNVKMDEKIIDALPFEELRPLKEYLQTKMLMGKVMTSKQAWINKVGEDNRIHGGIMQSGTITGRCAHFSPNLGNIPSIKKLYGKECRELFTVPKDKVMVGCDADSLEMRVLAGYLNKLDGGRLMKAVLEGNKEDGTDPHSMNMRAYEITNRECAKTLYYAGIYGSKNAKLGSILLDFGIKLEEYVPEFDKNVKGMIEWVNEKNKKDIEKGNKPMERTENYWKCWCAGKHLTTLFGDKMPELPLLKENIKKLFISKGYVKGLDGRKLRCRTEHGQLNTVCQAAGAIITKKAMQIMDEDLQNQGLLPGKDYEFILFVHDEWQLEVTDDVRIIEIVKNVLPKAIEKAGLFFNFPTPMTGNVQIGKRWSDTH